MTFSYFFFLSTQRLDVRSISNFFMNIDDFFKDVKNNFIRLISHQLSLHKSVKVNVELFGRFLLQSKETLEIKSFNTKNKVITVTSNLLDIYTLFLNEIKEKISIFAENGSGWALDKKLHLDINVNKYNPLRASSYIPLPKQIAKKLAVINIKNNDNYCFAWSIISALFPSQKNVNRTTSYPNFFNILNFKEIEFPVKLKDIKKFENLNKISVNVYGLESIYVDNILKYEVVGPYYFTEKKITFTCLSIVKKSG